MIEYKYLDVDNEALYDDYQQFLDAMRDRAGKALMRVIPNYKHNQILYAGGAKTNGFGERFTECEAIFMCRKLSGLDRLKRTD